jgi:hypothetical protein
LLKREKSYSDLKVKFSGGEVFVGSEDHLKIKKKLELQIKQIKIKTYSSCKNEHLSYPIKLKNNVNFPMIE